MRSLELLLRKPRKLKWEMVLHKARKMISALVIRKVTKMISELVLRKLEPDHMHFDRQNEHLEGQLAESRVLSGDYLESWQRMCCYKPEGCCS
jgi:hypothetical protein